MRSDVVVKKVYVVMLDAETQKSRTNRKVKERKEGLDLKEFSSRLEASASILEIATRVCAGVEA